MTVVTIPVMPEARFELNQRRAQSSCKALFTLLDEVKDPEIPVLSIWELGVLQNVEEINGAITITLTPTYPNPTVKMAALTPLLAVSDQT